MEIDTNKEYKIKELCEILGIEYCVGSPKLSLKKIERCLELKQITKQKFKIIRIYSDVEFRKKIDPYYEQCRYSQFLVEDELATSSGIYIIQKDNDIYIGQTKNFKKRFGEHRRGDNPSSPTKEMIEQGATFKVLELEDDEEQRFIKERKWVEHYKGQAFNLVNGFETLYKKDISFKAIKVRESDYDEIMELLSENGYDIT